MPTYCFEREDNGCIEEVTCSYVDLQEMLDDDGGITTEDGVKASRSLVAEHGGYRHTPGTYPFWSDAAGVNPDQIPEAMEADRSHGVLAEYNSEGQVKFESRDHRRKYLQAHKMHDNDGCYITT